VTSDGARFAAGRAAAGPPESAFTCHPALEPVPVARLLRPRSIAIAGISPEPGSFGANVLTSLRSFGYRGDIHLVSRGRTEVLGRACVATIDDLPAGIDVAVLCVPRAAVAEAVAACGRRRMGGAIVFASGFGETGEAGLAEQDALAASARRSGLALLGPNCLGLVNQVDGVPLSMGLLAPVNDRALRVGLVAQSGAMVSAIREAARARGVGFSHMISTGNEAVVGMEDFTAELIADEATRVIALFVEQIRRPRLFLALAARAREAGKAIVMFHSGRSAAARASARSHTGALAGDFRTMAALVAHQGVIRVDSFDELIDTMALLARHPQPPLAGVGVITNSGAFCGIAHDVAAAAGLEISRLSPSTSERLRTLVPSFAAADNPLDLGTQLMREPQLLGTAAQAMLEDDNIGSVVVAVVLGTPQQALDKAQAALPVLDEATKPAALAAIGGEAILPADFLAGIDAGKTVFFRSPERALRAMAHLTTYGRALQRRRIRVRMPEATAVAPPGTGVLAEYLAKPWLAAAGIPVPRGSLARDASEAVDIARTLGFPVVLKAQAKDLLHKSDIGGVILGVRDANGVRQGWDDLQRALARSPPALRLDGVLVEQMVPPGIEMVIGARNDPDWGAVVMVGLGGIWVEALDDVRLLAPDATMEEITGEVAKLRGARLLEGARGTQPADVTALAEIVASVAALMRARPELVEIDLNPVVVHARGEGACALDALVVVAP
jgi:acyl-CoA synthetase (NDP forming)